VDDQGIEVGGFFLVDSGFRRRCNTWLRL